MAAADAISTIGSEPKTPTSSCAAMNTASQNPINPNVHLLDEVRSWAVALGYSPAAKCSIAITIDGEPAAMLALPPLPKAPVLDDVEREVVDAIDAAGGPLQQKEIATAAGLSVRVIQRTTPRLVERGILLRHPSLGFYLPGMRIAEDK